MPRLRKIVDGLIGPHHMPTKTWELVGPLTVAEITKHPACWILRTPEGAEMVLWCDDKDTPEWSASA